MITYSKTVWGLHLLYRLYGSALLRCAPFTAASGVMTALLFIYWGKEDRDAWRHPYPYALSAFIVGFVVVFRSNFGYQRYWEGRTDIQQMTMRWADAYTQAIVFFSGDPASGSPASTPERAAEFRDALMHLMSLVHGLAVQHLRGDWDLHNLRPTHAGDLPPPVDSASLQYMFGPAERKNGTWRYPIADFFLLRGTEQKRTRYNSAMPLGVVGGMSVEEAQLLGSAMQMYGETTLDSSIFGTDIRVDKTCNFFGLSTGRYVPGAAERVNLVYSWILQLLQQRYTEGGLVIPAPIAANLYRMLSEGLAGFENARKLADTPFPFPWAQAVLLMLLIFSFTSPLLMVAYVERLWLAILLDVITVQSYFSLNEVARDLEDPFVFEPNDLPMARIQYQFNERLKAASYSRRPPYFWNGRFCMSQDAEQEQDGSIHGSAIAKRLSEMQSNIRVEREDAENEVKDDWHPTAPKAIPYVQTSPPDYRPSAGANAGP